MQGCAQSHRMGNQTISLDPMNRLTLTWGDSVLLCDECAQVRTDWKSAPLMELPGKGALLSSEDLPGAKRLVSTVEAKGVGTLRREVLLLPEECIFAWDAKLDTPHERLLAKIGFLIPHDTIAGRDFRLIDGSGRILSDALKEEKSSSILYSRREGGYTHISEHLDTLPGALAPDFRVPAVRQVLFNLGERTVRMDLAYEADGQWAVGEFEGDVRKREPFRVAFGVSSKVKAFRARAVLRVRVLGKGQGESEFEEWTLSNDALDVIDDGFALTALRDKKWALAGEPVRVRVESVGAPRGKGELPVSYVLADYWDRAVEQGEFRLGLGGDAPSAKVLSFSIRPTGMYRLTLRYGVPGTDRTRERQAIFAVLPRLANMPKDSLFGAHVPMTEYYAKLAAAAGVSWVRLWHTTLWRQNMWNAVEPTPGQFVFDDREIRLAKQYGLNLLCQLQGVPTWLDPRSTREADVGYAAGFEDMDKVLPPWIEYVKQSVAHYKDSIRHWEVLNEPGFSHKFFRKHPEVYVRLLKPTYEAIKATDPQAVVIGSDGPVGWGMDWFEKVFQLGGLSSQDAISIHYASRRSCATPDWDIEGTRCIRSVRGLMPKYGDVKPIWNTEDMIWLDGFFYQKTAPPEQRDVGAYDPGKIPPPVYHEACNRLVRLYLMHISENIRCFYLHWFGSGWWHLCEHDHTPTPPVVAYAVMADLLAGAKYQEHLAGNGIQCHLLQRRDGGPIAVLFAQEDGAAGSLVVPLAAGKVKAVNIMGNGFALTGDDKTTRVPVTREPVYLIGEGLSLADFQSGIRAGKLSLPNGAAVEPWGRGGQH